MRLNIVMSKYDFKLDLNQNTAHTKIIQKIQSNSTILEFGPAHGVMTAYLKNELNCKVYAVEIDPLAAEDAKVFCEDILIDSIESYRWKSKYSGLLFDCIIFADVLEHLYNPWKVLEEVKPFLAKNGRIFISLPNIANNAVIMGLIDNEFKYTPVGLLDNTHIRFFTKKSIDEMIRNAGYMAYKIEATFQKPYETELKKSYLDCNSNDANMLFNKAYGDVYQFIYELGVMNQEYTELSQDVIQEPYSIKVFFDFGRGFETNPINFSTIGVGKIKLPANVKRVRFDPSNAPGRLFLSKFNVEDIAENLYTCPISDLCGFDFHLMKEAICLGDNPQILMEIPISNAIYLHYEFGYEHIIFSSEDIASFGIVKELQEKVKVFSSVLGLEQSFTYLHYDDGTGFNGINVIRCRTQFGKDFLYEFPLSEVENIQSIRIDPAELPVKVKVDRLYIIDATGTSHNIAIAEHNADKILNQQLYFFHDDSNLILDKTIGLQLSEKIKIVIEMKVDLLSSREVSQYYLFERNQSDEPHINRQQKDRANFKLKQKLVNLIKSIR